MRAPLIAILNTSHDTVELLREVMQQAGFSAATLYIHEIREGRVDLDAWMREQDPVVIVYDIGVPYQENWDYFQKLRQRPALASRQFVLTTPNAREVAKIAGSQQHLFEIVGRPLDLMAVVQAVKEAARARPTR